MASLGEAFIDVHADTNKLAPEIEAGTRKAVAEAEAAGEFDDFVKAADKAGSRAGDGFGKSFIRDASGRLRDEKGRFVSEGEKIGKEVGDRMGNAIADRNEKTLRTRISSLGRTLAPAWTRTIFAWIAAIAPAAIQLVGTLAPAVGILAAIVPAALGGAAALGILKIAFGGLGDLVKLSTTDMAAFNEQLAKLGPQTQQFVKVLVALKPVLADFKKQLQDSFFAGFNENATFNRLNNALKVLKSNIDAIAFTLGQNLGQALKTLLSGTGLTRLNEIFGNFDDTLTHLGPILSHLISALLTIGQAAGPLFEKLIGGFDRVTGRFDAFLTKSANSGALNKFFDTAFTAFQQLIGLVTDLGSIIGSIFSAAGKAGGGGAILTFFHQLALAVAELNKNGTLTEFFKAFNEVGSSLGKILAPLLPVIGKLAGILGGSFLKIIEAITPPLVAISQSIADALLPVLPALGQALDALAPVLAEVGDVLADVIKQVTPDLANVLVDLFVALADTFVQLAPSLKIILPALGELAVVLIKLLAVQTISFLQAFVQVLPLLADALLVIVSPLLLFTKLLQGVVYVLDHYVSPFLQNFPSEVDQSVSALGDIAGKIGEFFSDVAKGISDFFTVTIPKEWDKFVTFLENLPTRIVESIKAALKQGTDEILTNLGIALGVIVFTITKLPGRLLDALKGLGVRFAVFLTEEWHKGVIVTTAFVDELKRKVQALPGQLVDALSSLGSKIGKVFSNAFDSAVRKVSNAIANIVNYVRNLPGRLVALGGRLLSAGASLITHFLNGLAHPGKIINSISDTIFGFLKGKLNYVIGKINNGINSVGKYVGGLPNIPYLAKGAFLNHPTLAVLGEAGPEVVLPVNDPARARQLLDESGLTQSLDFHSSAPTVLVTVRIGEQELNQIVDTRVSYANDRTSRQLAYGARTI